MADRPQTMDITWMRGGARTWPRSHRSGRKRLQAATTSTARLFIHFLLLRLSVLAEAEDPSQPHRRALPRGRASSPSHRSPPNPDHGSALGPSISSTSCLSPSSRGKGTLPTSPHSELIGVPPLLRSSVASAAQHASIPSHPCFVILVAYRNLGEEGISQFEL
jgi:hypothetical protein